MRLPSLSIGSKICDDCRKQLGKIPDPTLPCESEIAQAAADDNEPDYEVSEPLDLSSINQCFGEIGQTPIIKQKLQQQKYPKQKIKKIATALKQAVIKDTEFDESDDESEIIKQLKD